MNDSVLAIRHRIVYNLQPKLMKKSLAAIVLLFSSGLAQAAFDSLPREFFLKETLNQDFTRLEICSGQGEVYGSLDFNLLKQQFAFRDVKGQLDSVATVKTRRESYGFEDKIIRMKDAGGFNLGSIEHYPEEAYLLLRNRRGKLMAFVDQSTARGIKFIVRNVVDKKEIMRIERSYLGWVKEGDLWRVRSVGSINQSLIRPLVFLAVITTRNDYFKKTFEFYTAALKHSKSYSFSVLLKSLKHTPILKRIETDYKYDYMKYRYHTKFERDEFIRKFKLKGVNYTEEDLKAARDAKIDDLGKAIPDHLRETALKLGIAKSKIELKQLAKERADFERKDYSENARLYEEAIEMLPATTSAQRSHLLKLQNESALRGGKMIQLDKEIASLKTEEAQLLTEMGDPKIAEKTIKELVWFERAYSTLASSFDLEKYYINYLEIGKYTIRPFWIKKFTIPFFGRRTEFNLTDLRIARDEKIAADIKAGKDPSEATRLANEAKNHLEQYFFDKDKIIARRDTYLNKAGLNQNKRNAIGIYFNGTSDEKHQDGIINADRERMRRDYFLKMLNLTPAASREEVQASAGQLFHRLGQGNLHPEQIRLYREEIEQGRDFLLTYFENNPTLAEANRKKSWFSRAFARVFSKIGLFSGFDHQFAYKMNPNTQMEFSEMEFTEEDI